MAVQAPNYTGENSGAGLYRPTGERVLQSQEKMLGNILEAEKFKYSTRKKEEEDFLKNVQITPEYVISSKARQDQATAIQSFNDRWGAIMKQRKGVLSLQDKTQMASEKSLLMSSQQAQQEQMGQWKIIHNMVTQNPTKYDTDEWAQITDEYMRTGQFNLTNPPIKAQSIDLALSDNQLSGTAYDKNRTFYSATEPEARDYVKRFAMSNPAYLKDIVKQFQGLDPQTKLQYLDVNKDNTISPQEAQDVNPILKWAQDSKWQKAVKVTPHLERAPRASGTGASATEVAKQKAKTGVFSPKVEYGTNTYINAYKFSGTDIIRNVPTQGAKGIYGDYEDVLASGNVAGRLLLFDPKKDVLVFETIGSSESADTRGTTLVEVPASNLTGVDTYPIEINGVRGTIGELRAREQSNRERSVTPQETSSKWDKYRR